MASPAIVPVTPAAYAPHIGSIQGDTIVVAGGSTNSFTVDTPEEQGLVSTHPTVQQLLRELKAIDGASLLVTDPAGTIKTTGTVVTGDRLTVTSAKGKIQQRYILVVRPLALTGQLQLLQSKLTVKTPQTLTLQFTAGQRSPDVEVALHFPAGINITLENTSVNVIGRGVVKLKDLEKQSIGRAGSSYSYSKVGEVSLKKLKDGSFLLALQHLDLRPANGPDLVITIQNVQLPQIGKYPIKATYTVAKPNKLSSTGSGTEVAVLTVVPTISDFTRVLQNDLQYKEQTDTYTQLQFTWTAHTSPVSSLQQSLDQGKTWTGATAALDVKKGTAFIKNLKPGQLYHFRLQTAAGASNTVRFFSGKVSVVRFGATGDSTQDYTDAINKGIAWLHELGGGTLLFPKGIYSVRTIHLQSNVYLFLTKEAVIRALKGADAPEATWFSDKKYRSGLSPTDPGPYADPENYMTKQDVGHHYFHNTMFFGERLDNVKIIGNGYITGNGNLVTGDRVMNNTPDNRADKMFTLKLCTNIEIGGLHRADDLWYDSARDEPYYIGKNGEKDFNVDNMLHIDRGGHFVLLATGTDAINVHDTYFGKYRTSSARDIYDFMACNKVMVTNIYSKVSSDDIVKPGSDCSLGFTRPAGNYKVRNVIGDTNCNLFQIGSETADDIMDICVDNIYVLGANKAGFSISTNDGGYIKNIHLNCGHTGTLHSRSKMFRTFAPFFISISNRARILGAEAGKYAFTDNGEKHHELLIRNVSIGQVENIIINGIDIAEVYAGSSYSGTRWKPYDGKQRRATPIIAGYALPDTKDVEGGLDFKLPNGKHTGYIKNVVFNDVHVLVKGTNPLSDTAAIPPELGVGQYNASNLRIQPSYGLWARHVEGLTLTNSSFNFEKPDQRYAIFLDDVQGAKINNVKMVRTPENESVIKLKNATGITVENTVYFKERWGNQPITLPRIDQAKTDGGLAFPAKSGN